jgi:hypothetical protein
VQVYFLVTEGTVEEKLRQQQVAERLARRSRVAEAGGQLLAATFTLLGEMIPQREPTNGAAQMAGELKARLDECLERDEQGRPRPGQDHPEEPAAIDSKWAMTSSIFPSATRVSAVRCPNSGMGILRNQKIERSRS